MQTRMPCGLDDPRIRLEPSNLDHARAVEDYTDSLMVDCKNHAFALNSEFDLFDGDLLPSLMVEVANWDGSPESSHVRMKAMHNLLANALQKIAEQEVA